MPRQLTLDLARRPALGRDDFFVAPPNALAVAMIDDPGAWPGGKLLLIGPEGAGKTHLAHVFAAEMGACVLTARDLAEADIPALAQAPVVIEDVATIADDPEAQTALFHLHNLCAAEGRPLLMTARDEPHRWGLSLPDLQSRMQGTQVARLDQPDDTLLTAVLMKLFEDRQLSPAPDVLPFLLKRIDRSFAAAGQVVRDLDAAALDAGRAITTRFAGQVLDISGKSE